MKTLHEGEGYARIRKISVVWKYVCYGLFLSCIPLIVLSFYFIHAEKVNIAENQRQIYEKVAEAAASSFFENVQAIQSAGISLTTEIRMQDRYLGQSVANDKLAVRILSSHQKMLPFVAGCGLYTFQKPETVYYSDGVWKKDVFERYVIKEKGLFESVLKNKNRLYFSGWSEEDQALICALPVIHSNEELPRRVFFFVMNSLSIKDGLSMAMLSMPEARVAGIRKRYCAGRGVFILLVFHTRVQGRGGHDARRIQADAGTGIKKPSKESLFDGKQLKTEREIAPSPDFLAVIGFFEKENRILRGPGDVLQLGSVFIHSVGP